MFAIAIRYLCGWASAASANKDEPEWPLHPDRAFMALVAAYMETGTDKAELETLQWLQEKLDNPHLSVGLDFEIHAAVSLFRRNGEEERVPVPVYVPVSISDEELRKGRKGEEILKILPSERKRDKRFFPAVIPECDVVHLIWPDVELPAEHRAALEGLCAKVGYVGDTSSLVQMWVEDNPPPPTLIPSNPSAFTRRLRVFRSLAELQADYERDKQAGEYRPRSFLWGYYQEPEEEKSQMPSSHFDQFLILRRADGPSLSIANTLNVAKVMRDTVLSIYRPQWANDHTLTVDDAKAFAQRAIPILPYWVEGHRLTGDDRQALSQWFILQPAPEWVSGHTAEGQRSKRESGHLALVPLPNVGYEHSDGDLKGMALAVPQDTPSAELKALLDMLFPWDEEEGETQPLKLKMGRNGVWHLEPVQQSRSKMVALRKHIWLGPAERWASVTPIVLDRYPKKGESKAEEMVAAACERIGLPRPREVVLMPGSLFIGAPPAKRFPALPNKFGKTLDQHTHALLIFNQAVRGPVLLGAGRYRGYGLCRPYHLGDDE